MIFLWDHRVVKTRILVCVIDGAAGRASTLDVHAGEPARGPGSGAHARCSRGACKRASSRGSPSRRCIHGAAVQRYRALSVAPSCVGLLVHHGRGAAAFVSGIMNRRVWWTQHAALVLPFAFGSVEAEAALWQKEARSCVCVCTTAKSSIHAVQASTSRSTRPSARAQRDGTSTDLSSPNACDVISFAKSDPDLNRGTTIRFLSPGPRPGKAGLGRFILGQWSHQSTRGPRFGFQLGGQFQLYHLVSKSQRAKN